jgi:hypothetical protein
MLICIAKSPMEGGAMFEARNDHPFMLADGSKGVLAAYEYGYQAASDDGQTNQFVWRSDIIAYVHDDCEIDGTDWYDRVEAEFDDPTVGLVGFGGATRHGTPDLYKRPYKLTNLARFNYFSNQKDAEVHGQRFTGSMDVAVLDGFALIVRREILDKAGGWPVDSPIKFHCYDYWLCCMARRNGYRIRMVGVACDHHGGRTSTRPEYAEWLMREFGKTDQHVHEESHRYVWDSFKDVLPWEVK